MNESLFHDLAAALDRRGGGFPAIKSTIFKELLDAIFTEDEAILATLMPATPCTAIEMSKKTGKDLVATQEALQTMAKKGILFSTTMGAHQIYQLLPMIPGILENQIMKGGVDERTRNIAHQIDAYISLLVNLEKTDDKRLPKVPFARVISVEQGIPTDSTVQPYDKLLTYINQAEDFALATCHCRHVGELQGDPCSKPKDVCLAIGMAAKYLAEYGMARAISREEARDKLKRAEEAGLVHMVGNTGDQINFICNCCSCHCDMIKSMKRSPRFARAARSSFVAEVKADDCVGCGNCLPRCPVDAITMQEETAIIAKHDCIGCGLCISTCPPEAIVLRAMAHAPQPYANDGELNQAIIASKITL